MFRIRRQDTGKSQTVEHSFPDRVAQQFEAYRSQFAAVNDAVREIASEAGEQQLGSYALVVGDDTSGRLPALILHQIINRIRVRSGAPKVPILFIQTNSGLSDNQDPLEAAWARRAGIWKGLAGQRALVVTEYIQTGRHLAQLSNLLGNASIPFDVATLGSDGLDAQVKDTARVPEGTRIFDGKGGLLLYRETQLTGLSSEKCREPKREHVPMDAVAAARLHVRTIAEKVDQRLQEGLC